MARPHSQRPHLESVLQFITLMLLGWLDVARPSDVHCPVPRAVQHWQDEVRTADRQAQHNAGMSSGLVGHGPVSLACLLPCALQGLADGDRKKDQQAQH